MKERCPVIKSRRNQFILVGILSFFAIFVGMEMVRFFHTYSDRQSSIHNNTSDKTQNLVKSFFSQQGSRQ